MTKDRLAEYSAHRGSVKLRIQPDNTTIETEESPLTPNSISSTSLTVFLAKMESVYETTGLIRSKVTALKEVQNTRMLDQPTKSPLKFLALSFVTVPVHIACEADEHDLITHEVLLLCNRVKFQLRELSENMFYVASQGITENEERIRKTHTSEAAKKLVELISEYSQLEVGYSQWRKTFSPENANRNTEFRRPQEDLVVISFNPDVKELKRKEMLDAENDLREINGLIQDIAFYVQTENQSGSIDLLQKQARTTADETSGAVKLVDKALVKESRTRRKRLRRNVKIGIAFGVICVKIILLLIYLKFGDHAF